MKYVSAKLKSRNEEMLFRVYVTDSLKGIYKYFGGEISARYYDLIFNKGKVENRNADEIISDIREKLNKISEV